MRLYKITYHTYRRVSPENQRKREALARRIERRKPKVTVFAPDSPETKILGQHHHLVKGEWVLDRIRVGQRISRVTKTVDENGLSELIRLHGQRKIAIEGMWEADVFPKKEKILYKRGYLPRWTRK